MSEKDSSKRIRLTVEGGPTREFPGDRTFVIGRSQNVDFSIPHPNLSREHVRFSLKEGEVWLEDLGSANGTFVQGQRLPAKSSVLIKPHYRILLGTGSNVMISVEVVEGYEPLPAPEPKGDVDLSTARERTLAAISRNQVARAEQEALPAMEKSRTLSRNFQKMELDFPQQHFPHEVKKEKVAELRILEAKKVRVLEDIQYKEREIEDLRVKIRALRDESFKLKEQSEAFKKEIQPLTDRKLDLEKCVQELEVIYDEKIDALETGFQDLKSTLDESHAVRMARADKEYKEKTRRLDESFAAKLQSLESEIESVRGESVRLRDTLVKEKKVLEENVRKVRSEAEALEADRRLAQVRIDTEIAKLQGAKLKIENEIESIRQEREKARGETAHLLEQGKMERVRIEEARRGVEAARREQEELRKTVADIKQSEEKNLTRIGELKSHIATLETRADSVKALIRQAELEAEMVRRQAKEDAEAYRKAVQEEAESERQAITNNAEAQAMARLQATEVQATMRVETAEAQAVSRLEKAQADAHTVVERARADANQYFEEKKMAADELLAKAEARAHELEHGSKNQAERAVADASAALDAKRKALEDELITLRKRTDQEIRLVRSSALADIEAAKDREAKEITARLKSRAKSIGDQIDRIVGAKLSAQFGVNMDPVTLKAFSTEIHKIVEQVIGPSKGGALTATHSTHINHSEKTMSTIMNVDSKAQDRAVRYWHRVGVAAAITAVLVIGKVAAPEAYSWAGEKIGKVFEVKDNTDAVVKRMLRDRQLAMTFVTEQDQRLRGNYTDNILYTEGFIEMKEDIESQKVWTLGLNKFFQTDLGLTEKAIVQFGSAEGRMIRDLVEQRKGIVPQNSVTGIQKMRETEATFVKEMKVIVRTDANWQKYLSFQRDFYLKYTQSFATRLPAATAIE